MSEVDASSLCHYADRGLWSGPGVRLPPEALHACGGDPVVPIARAAAGSQGESLTQLQTLPVHTERQFREKITPARGWVSK